MTDLKDISKPEALLLLLSSVVIVLTLFLPFTPSIISYNEGGNLIASLHLKTNAYFHLTALGQWASGRVGCAILIVCGLLGMMAVLGFYKVPAAAAMAVSSILYGTLMACFGGGFFIIAPLTLLPWIYLIICSANSPKLSFLVLLSTLIFILWLFLYSLSLPVLLLAIILHLVVDRKSIEPTTAAILFLGCTMLFLLTLLSPTLPWPDYPPLARVTMMMDGPAWLARPLTGDDLPFRTIDRSSVISDNVQILLPLAIAILIVGFLIRNNPLAKRAWLCCAAVFVFAFLDLRLPEEMAQIAPLQSLPRLIPELNQIALAPVAIGFVIAGLLLICFIMVSTSNILLYSGLLLSSVALSLSNHSFKPLTPDDALSSQLPIQWTSSPSRFVTAFFSPEILQSAAKPWHGVRPKAAGIIASSSAPAPVDGTLLFDRDNKTRWSPGTSTQTGTEWLMLELVQPQKIVGIELLTGEYATDFPRGINIKVGKTCDLDKMLVVQSFPSWQGNPEFTPAGFPYFSPQSSVRIFFESEMEANCIRIEQTGQSGNFDWSVAEVKLIKRDVQSNQD